MEEENNYNQPQQEATPINSTPVQPLRPELHQVANDNLEDKVFAALSYVSILFVVPLILKNEDEDIHFHAKQGLVLFASEIIVWFALFLLDTFLTAIFPSGELFVVRVLGALAWVGFMAMSIAGVYMAARGRRWQMPIIGRIAQKLKV